MKSEIDFSQATTLSFWRLLFTAYHVLHSYPRGTHGQYDSEVMSLFMQQPHSPI
jgi:hypothetical protein